MPALLVDGATCNLMARISYRNHREEMLRLSVVNTALRFLVNDSFKGASAADVLDPDNAFTIVLCLTSLRSVIISRYPCQRVPLEENAILVSSVRVAEVSSTPATTTTSRCSLKTQEGKL